jgi:polyisoprenoid-binding protein YceI
MATTTQQEIPTGTWQADSVHSHVGFAVKHMVVSTFRGRFEDYEARLSTEGGEPRLIGVVRTESIVVKDENLAAHLRSPDFFDVERHPEMRFVSTSIRREGDRLLVAGDLTLKGHTHRVEGEGTIVEPTDDAFGGTRLGLELEAVIDRTAFGLEWNAPLPKGGFALANDVKLGLDLEFVRV